MQKIIGCNFVSIIIFSFGMLHVNTNICIKQNLTFRLLKYIWEIIQSKITYELLKYIHFVTSTMQY